MIGVRNGIIIEAFFIALIVMAWNLSGCASPPTASIEQPCPESPDGMSLGEFADNLSRCVEKVG